MADTSRAEVSKVARVKGKVKKSWKFIKAQLKNTLRTTRSLSPTEPVHTIPSPRETDISTYMSVPEDNPTFPRLPGFSGLDKLRDEDDFTYGAEDYREPASQRQETGSIKPNISVSGISESDSGNYPTEIVQDQTQNYPFSIHIEKATVSSVDTQGAAVQPALAQKPQVQDPPGQITPAQNMPAQVQLSSVKRVRRKMAIANLTTSTPVLAHPDGTLDQPPGLPLLFPPETFSRQPVLLDPQNPQRKTPINPADLLQSFSPAMDVPTHGAPHLSNQTIPNTPNTQPFLPRIPRPRPQPKPTTDPVLPVEREYKRFGVIGDHRAAKNQLIQAQGVDSAQVQTHTPSEPVYTYPNPIYAKNYYVGRCLGGGAAAKVYSALNMKSMTTCGLKVIKRRDLGFDLSMVKVEVDIMQAISETKRLGSKKYGPLLFVNHLVECWYDRDRIYFVMPLCVDSLHNHLKRTKLDPLAIRVYAAELMCGLEALHEMKILHCDLKPDNILVSPDGHLMISDFGLSMSWLDPRFRDRPLHDLRNRKLVGTDGYMAPEIVSAFVDPDMPLPGNFGFAADIWSLGIIFAELGMGGRRFISSVDEEGSDFKRFARTMTLSRKRMINRVWENLRGDHAMLVERMLQMSEANRATSNEIASHPFFSELDMVKVLSKGYPVPVPPLERVLPCRHTNVDEIWYGNSKGRGEPSSKEDSRLHTEQALCSSQDIDRYIIPDNFVWNMEDAIKKLS